MDATLRDVVNVLRHDAQIGGVSLLRLMDYVMICVLVRQDNLQAVDVKRYPMIHPFSSLVNSMGLCFVGSTLCSQALRNGGFLDDLTDRILIPTIIAWYLVNYCPFDVFYNFLRNKSVCITFVFAREIFRLQLIDKYVDVGIGQIGSRYETYGICVFALVLVRVKSSHLLRKTLLLKSNDENTPINFSVLFCPAPSTKFYMVSSLLLLIEKDVGLSVKYETLYVILLIGFLSRRLINMRGGIHHLKGLSGKYDDVDFLGYDDMKEFAVTSYKDDITKKKQKQNQKQKQKQKQK